MVLGEVRPGRDYAAGVPAGLAHVLELHAIRVGTELGPQQVDLVRRDHHENGLLGRQPTVDERGRALREVARPRIEQGLMAEAVGAHGRGHPLSLTYYPRGTLAQLPPYFCWV